MIPLNLLPDAYRTSWCVAGGWAACPSLAGDQDVWVFGYPDLKKLRVLLLKHLAEGRFQFQEEGQTQTGSSYSLSFGILKVAEVTLPNRLHAIHLMVTNHASALAIIETFDISTHQIAITHDGNVILGSGWTPLTQPPVMISTNIGKPTTPARMHKLALRYNHQPPRGTHERSQDQQSDEWIRCSGRMPDTGVPRKG